MKWRIHANNLITTGSFKALFIQSFKFPSFEALGSSTAKASSKRAFASASVSNSFPLKFLQSSVTSKVCREGTDCTDLLVLILQLTLQDRLGFYQIAGFLFFSIFRFFKKFWLGGSAPQNPRLTACLHTQTSCWIQADTF